MAYIPEDAKWYIADIIEEIQIEGESENVVHINTVLVRAASPGDAYTKALELGAEHETSYKNTNGQTVTCSFRGLGGLLVVYDEFEHGSELYYEEMLGVSEDKLGKMLKAKNDLAIFRPREPLDGPDYAPGYILSALREAMKKDNSSKEAFSKETNDNTE